MNPAVHLLHLRQGNRPIEEFVEDFFGLSHLLDFNDIALKDIFWFGLTEEISCLMIPHTPHWTLAECIEHVLQLCAF